MEYFQVYCSYNNGSDWTQIDSVGGTALSCPWTPDQLTSEGKIKIESRDVAGNADTCITSYTFNVITGSPPQVTVTNPVLDELWYVGQTDTVDWNVTLGAYPLQSQKLFIFAGNDTLVDSTLGADERTLAITVPSVYSVNVTAKVIAYDTQNQTGFDVSEVFNIAPNTLITTMYPYWNLFSIPLTPADNTTASVLGDDITGGYFVFSFTQNVGYSVVNSLNFGQGYWLCMEDTFAIDIDGEPEVDSCYFSISEGWNIVGAAIPDTVFKDSLKVKYNGTIYDFNTAVIMDLVADNLYSFDPATSSYDPDTEQLVPWKGYWLKANHNGMELIAYPPVSGGTLDLAEAVKTPNRNGWFAPIIVSQGDIVIILSGVGMNEAASDGYDSFYDAIMPPVPPSGVYLRAKFSHPEWNVWVGNDFCRDIRSPFEDEKEIPQVKEWVFTIESSDTGLTTVNFQKIAKLIPEGYGATASYNNTTINLKQTPSFQFEYSLPLSVTFKLYNSAAVLLGWDITGVTGNLPDKYSIASIRPNPFNPVTTICIGLPEAGDLNLVVYNIQGREVQKLSDGFVSAGYHNFKFDGTMLSSGMYFVKAEVPGKMSELRKIILIK